MATAAEIREKAVRRLNIVSRYNTTPSPIQNSLDDAYTEVYAMLSKRRLTTWDFDQEVPDEFVNPVVDLVAYSRANEFKIPNELYTRIGIDANGTGTALNPGALATIKTLQASNVYKTPSATYF